MIGESNLLAPAPLSAEPGRSAASQKPGQALAQALGRLTGQNLRQSAAAQPAEATDPDPTPETDAQNNPALLFESLLAQVQTAALTIPADSDPMDLAGNSDAQASDEMSLPIGLETDPAHSAEEPDELPLLERVEQQDPLAAQDWLASWLPLTLAAELPASPFAGLPEAAEADPVVSPPLLPEAALVPEAAPVDSAVMPALSNTPLSPIAASRAGNAIPDAATLPFATGGQEGAALDATLSTAIPATVPPEVPFTPEAAAGTGDAPQQSSSTAAAERPEASPAAPIPAGFTSAAAAALDRLGPMPPAPPLATQLSARVAQDLRQAVVEEEGVTRVVLRPAGLGLIEMELTRDAQERLHLAIRVQNPMVLAALRHDRIALDGILSAHSTASPGVDLTQSGAGGDDPRGFGHGAGREDAKDAARQSGAPGQNGQDRDQRQSGQTTPGDAPASHGQSGPIESGAALASAALETPAATLSINLLI